MTLVSGRAGHPHRAGPTFPTRRGDGASSARQRPPKMEKRLCPVSRQIGSLGEAAGEWTP
jgi:hypothetical protein